MIGFDGLLMSDDICMRARRSTRRSAAAALAAGCDVVLHCNGDLDEMREVANASPPLDGGSATQADAGAGDAERAPTIRSTSGRSSARDAYRHDGDGLRWPISLYQISILDPAHPVRGDLPRSLAWIRRLAARRRHGQAAGPGDLQSASAHRPLRDGDLCRRCCCWLRAGG